MKIRVLGSAAGGGFPQWNCNCTNCRGARARTIEPALRTQSSIAVSENGSDWLLINASPDLLAQIGAQTPLQPARGPRDSGICAVLLIDAQIDHVTGLLMLRERATALPLYATREVLAELHNSFPIIPLLSHYCGVDCREIRETSFSIPLLETVRISPLCISSKAPPYSTHRTAPEPGDNIALTITNTTTGASLFYAPGLGSIDQTTLEAMQRAETVLVDGTFWESDELIQLGFSKKTAADMGHLALTGPGGMIETLDRLDATRKILIHINNTNPILRADSPERRILDAHRIEVAFDGMEITL